MPLDITFTLSDQDLDHFQKIVDKAKTATESGESNASIEAAARTLIDDAKSTDRPEFISGRLSKLEVVINMVGDEEWQLSEEERNRVLGRPGLFLRSRGSDSGSYTGTRLSRRRHIRGNHHPRAQR